MATCRGWEWWPSIPACIYVGGVITGRTPSLFANSTVVAANIAFGVLDGTVALPYCAAGMCHSSIFCNPKYTPHRGSLQNQKSDVV
jgi:hypothetical protein